MNTGDQRLNLVAQGATVLLGLLTGGMLLLATGLVPYWRSLDPAEFTRVFDTSLPDVGGTLVVLTVLATAAVLVASGLAIWKDLPTRNWLIAASAGTLAMLITVPVYFAGANSDLADGELTAAEITDELALWQQVHWFRTIAGILALFCAIRAGYAARGAIAASAVGGTTHPTGVNQPEEGA